MPTPILHGDFETRSACDIKTAGAEAYARHPSTEVLCFAYCFDDEPVQLLAKGSDKDAKRILQHIRDGLPFVGHNVAFELAIWNQTHYASVPLDPVQCECTMAMAYSMALPGSLENAAAATGITNQKDQAGKRIMLKLSQPKEIFPWGEIVWNEDKDDLEKLYAYCKQDVETERELYKRLMVLSPKERKVWNLDYEINQRGIQIDLPAVTAAVKLVEEEKNRCDEKIREITGNQVATCNANAQFVTWLTSRGIACDSVAKAEVTEMLLNGAIPQDVREALELRREAAKSSNAKLSTMARSVCADGRARGVLQYHGAGTGRWAGRRIQVQNLPRPSIAEYAINYILDALPRGLRAEEIDLLFGQPLSCISSCLRGFIVAKEGHELMAMDFNAIEARVLAWLASDENTLSVFAAGKDVYKHEAARTYSKPEEKVTEEERDVGKVEVLALGYQGGVGALQTMCRGYGVKMSQALAGLWGIAKAEEKEKALENYRQNGKRYEISKEEFIASDLVKILWRNNHPEIVSYWNELDQASIKAVRNPGQKTFVGKGNRVVTYLLNGSFLWCRLPSGRVLCYPYPKVEEKETPWGSTKSTLTYMGVSSNTNKWEKQHSYGGLLAENITQAVARDLLVDAMLRLDSADYRVVMHVHDEIVCEEPLGQYDTLGYMKKVVEETPDWAGGLPIQAKGWRGKRFKKG